MEVLEDLDVGTKPRSPVMEALEDPDQGNEVHGSNGYHKTVSFRCQGENVILKLFQMLNIIL